jgi:hypothetical protein
MSLAKVTIEAEPPSVLKTRYDGGQQVADGHRILVARQSDPGDGEGAPMASRIGGVRKSTVDVAASTVPITPNPRPREAGVSAEDHVTDLVTECNSRRSAR